MMNILCLGYAHGAMMYSHNTFSRHLKLCRRCEGLYNVSTGVFLVVCNWRMTKAKTVAVIKTEWVPVGNVIVLICGFN